MKKKTGQMIKFHGVYPLLKFRDIQFGKSFDFVLDFDNYMFFLWTYWSDGGTAFYLQTTKDLTGNTKVIYHFQEVVDTCLRNAEMWVSSQMNIIILDHFQNLAKKEEFLSRCLWKLNT